MKSMETETNCGFGNELACLGGLNKVNVRDTWIQKQILYEGIHPRSSTNMMPTTTLIVLSYRSKSNNKSHIPPGEISYMNPVTHLVQLKTNK